MDNKLYKLIDLEESIIINEQLEEFKKEFTIQYIIENDIISDKDKIECLKNLNESINIFDGILNECVTKQVILNEFDITSTIKDAMNYIFITIPSKAMEIALNKKQNTKSDIKKIINQLKITENSPKTKRDLLNKLSYEIEKLKNLNKEEYDKYSLPEIQTMIMKYTKQIANYENSVTSAEELINRQAQLKNNKNITDNDFNNFLNIYNQINHNFSLFIDVFSNAMPLLVYTKTTYNSPSNIQLVDSTIGKLTDILNRFKVVIFSGSELFEYLKAAASINVAINQEEKESLKKSPTDKLVNNLSQDNSVSEILKRTFSKIESYAPWNWKSKSWSFIGLSGVIAAVSLGAYYFWKKFHKIKCDGLEGIELTKCEIKATDQAIKEAIRQKEQCYNQLNPSKCREEVEKIIERWKSRKNMLQDKLETKKSRPFEIEERPELF